jgi:homoserine kinase
LASLVRNTAHVGALVSACYSRDLGLLARSLKDAVATPARASLIPGCEAVMHAALEAGALGSGISGAGPSMFALCRSARSAAAVAAAMVSAFAAAGLTASSITSPAECPGVRRV